jgi:hypothetical protein
MYVKSSLNSCPLLSWSDFHKKRCINKNKDSFFYSEITQQVLSLSISRDELLKEIKEVQKFCEDNDITVFWV